jgi:hypothetical protein
MKGYINELVIFSLLEIHAHLKLLPTSEAPEDEVLAHSLLVFSRLRKPLRCSHRHLQETRHAQGLDLHDLTAFGTSQPYLNILRLPHF